MKQTITIQILASLLIMLFVYTAVSKLADHEMFRVQLIKFPSIGILSGILWWLIPITELCVAVLLLLPAYRRNGFKFSTLLLTIFSLFLVIMILFVPNLPCSCGGVISELSWPQHILFNLFFLLISITGMRLTKEP